jgi:hypothetical protein
MLNIDIPLLSNLFNRDNTCVAFNSVIPYFKDDHHQKQFVKDLVLFIANELVPLFFVELPFFQRLVMKQNPHVSFPSMCTLMYETLLKLIEKMKRNSLHNFLEFFTFAW